MSAAAWFWASIFANILISVAVGLQLPKIQRWFDDRGKTSHEKKKSRQADEYNNVTYYALHTDMLVGRMVSVAIWVSLYALTFSSMNYVRPTVDTIVDFLAEPFHPTLSMPHVARVIIVIVISLLFLGGLSGVTMIMMRQVISVHQLYLNVRYFKSFVESVPEELRDRDMEQHVLNAVRDRSVPGMNKNIEFMRELWRDDDGTD